MGPVVTGIFIGGPKQIVHGGKKVSTGIFKSPPRSTVKVNAKGIEGDVQVDLRFHGGADKAVYVYPDIHYRFWEQQLKRLTLEDSQFGENLNISLLDDEDVFIGDRYQVGSVIVEVTQPRIPCFKLGVRLQQETFPVQFLAAGRLGFYLRVEHSGEFKLGDSFSLLQRGHSGVTVFDLWRATFTAGGDRVIAKKALDSLPYLDEGWRKRLAGKLKR
jgi:MOSC domain-containing protein YiiM